MESPIRETACHRKKKKILSLSLLHSLERRDGHMSVLGLLNVAPSLLCSFGARRKLFLYKSSFSLLSGLSSTCCVFSSGVWLCGVPSFGCSPIPAQSDHIILLQVLCFFFPTAFDCTYTYVQRTCNLFQPAADIQVLSLQTTHIPLDDSVGKSVGTVRVPGLLSSVPIEASFLPRFCHA